MTGIDGSSTPFPRVQATLQRDAASGRISATDQTALTSALGDIQAQLAGAAPASGGTVATAATSSAPTSMKDRVGAAIDNEVATGKLTTDQASELKTAFQQVHAHMHGVHGHHGGGTGGLLAALTGSSTTDDGQSTDTTTGNGASANPIAATATSALGAIENFIAQFQSAIASNGPYSATGAGGSSATSLLVNSIG